jgi:hypothetical protein
MEKKLNSLPAIIYNLELMYEYYMFQKAYNNWIKEQKFMHYCLEIIENELQKELIV